MLNVPCCLCCLPLFRRGTGEQQPHRSGTVPYRCESTVRTDDLTPKKDRPKPKSPEGEPKILSKLSHRIALHAVLQYNSTYYTIYIHTCIYFFFPQARKTGCSSEIRLWSSHKGSIVPPLLCPVLTFNPYRECGEFGTPAALFETFLGFLL